MVGNEEGQSRSRGEIREGPRGARRPGVSDMCFPRIVLRVVHLVFLLQSRGSAGGPSDPLDLEHGDEPSRWVSFRERRARGFGRARDATYRGVIRAESRREHACFGVFHRACRLDRARDCGTSWVERRRSSRRRVQETSRHARRDSFVFSQPRAKNGRGSSFQSRES